MKSRPTWDLTEHAQLACVVSQSDRSTIETASIPPHPPLPILAGFGYISMRQSLGRVQLQWQPLQ